MWEDHILPGVPPEPKTLEDVKRRWKRAVAGATVEADIEITETIRTLQAAKAAEAEAKEVRKNCEVQLKAFMGKAEALLVNGEIRATWKNQKRTAVNTKRLKAENFDVWREFAETTELRRFLLKEGK